MEKISYYSDFFSDRHRKIFITKFLINFYSINDYIVINGLLINDITTFDLTFFPSVLNIDSKLGNKVCLYLLKEGICCKKKTATSIDHTTKGEDNLIIYKNGKLLQNPSSENKGQSKNNKEEELIYYEFDTGILFQIIKYKLELMKKCFSNKFHNLLLYRPYQFEVLCCFCNFKNLFREKIYDETCIRCGKNISFCNEKYIQSNQNKYTFILESLNALEYVQLPYLSAND
jgi:hypothetical protein